MNFKKYILTVYHLKQMKKNKTIKADARQKKYVMFGFQISDPDNIGYLKILKDKTDCGAFPVYGDIYQFVPDIEDATKFNVRNTDKISGFAGKAKWTKFFNNEAELSDFKFHPVTYIQDMNI